MVHVPAMVWLSSLSAKLYNGQGEDYAPAQYGFSDLAQTKLENDEILDERIQFEKETGLDTVGTQSPLKINVNWLDEVFNDRAPLQSYELSINRATDRLNYVSGGFYDQDGIAQIQPSAVQHPHQCRCKG